MKNRETTIKDANEKVVQLVLGTAFYCEGCKEVLPIMEKDERTKYDYCAICYNFGEMMDARYLRKNTENRTCTGIRKR